MKIILGRTIPTNFGEEETYQAFGALLVNQTGVSNMHATITIDDNGEWWLEDQWSTNGTYIREDDGRFRRIGNHEYPGKCKITPMTFIRLGTDDASGCCFYAKQAEQYGNSNNEFEFIKNKFEELGKIEVNKKKKIKAMSMFINYSPYIFLFMIIKPLTENIITFLAGFGGSSTLLYLLSRDMIKSLYDTQKKRKKIEKAIKKQKDAFAYCPNPQCNHVLSDREIANLQCNTCGISHN